MGRAVSGHRIGVAFKDTELGLIRLRAFGIFNLQVVQPVLFINSMVGTQGIYTTAEVDEYLNRVIVSRFNDYMGETIDSILNLPAKYDELAKGLLERVQEDFSHFGICMTHLYINAITPPPEVQQAIDDRSRMGVFDDMNKLMQMKAAMAMEKASESEGGSGMGMGTGLGLMMPAMFAQYFAKAQPQPGQHQPQAKCPECDNAIPAMSKFCPDCGNRIYHYNPAAMETVKLKLIPVDLDDDTIFEPARHVWVQEKLSWYQLPEGIKLYDTQP